MSVSSVIKQCEPTAPAAGVAFNFDDLSQQASHYLDKVRGQASEIVAAAQRDADRIRSEAQQNGRAAGQQDISRQVEQLVAQKLGSLTPALREAGEQLKQSREAWTAHWERAALEVACRMAARVCRRAIAQAPQISVELAREALELAAGASEIRVHLSPIDHETVQSHLSQLSAELGRLGEVQWLPDPALSAGGCRVETTLGIIDQTVDAQLARIFEELSGD